MQAKLAQNIDIEDLYSEYGMIKDIATAIIQKAKGVPCEEKWNQLFQKCEVGSLLNLVKMVQFVLFIPLSITECIFSIMVNTWSNTCNYFQVDVLMEEIQCKVNFSKPIFFQMPKVIKCVHLISTIDSEIYNSCKIWNAAVFGMLRYLKIRTCMLKDSYVLSIFSLPWR